MRWAAGKKGARRFARRPAEPSFSPHLALHQRDDVNMSNLHPEKQRRRTPNDTHGRQPQHGERSSLRRALQRSSARRGHWRATTRSTPGAHGRERTHTQPWDARTRARDLRHPPTPRTHQDTPAPIRAASSQVPQQRHGDSGPGAECKIRPRKRGVKAGSCSIRCGAKATCRQDCIGNRASEPTYRGARGSTTVQLRSAYRQAKETSRHGRRPREVARRRTHGKRITRAR